MGISEKVAYLKGLMEGMNLNADSNEGKLFLAIADVLDEIALEVEDLTDEVMELGDGLDVISDDLGDVEDIVYDEDEDDYEDEEDDEDDEEECYATTCPECEEEIFFDDSVLEDGKVECPNCPAGDQLQRRSQLRRRQRSVPASNFALPQERPPTRSTHCSHIVAPNGRDRPPAPPIRPPIEFRLPKSASCAMISSSERK